MTKDKSTNILGVLALIGVGAYLYKTKDAPEKSKLEGLSIDVDPEAMCENIRPFMGTDPQLQNIGVNVAKKIVNKALSPKVN